MKYLLVVISFLLPANILAQVQYVSSTSQQNSTEPADVLSYSFTVANNTNRLLLVCEGHRSNFAENSTTSVTYNSVGLTKAVETFTPSDSVGYASIWYMINPPVGTANIVITAYDAGSVRWLASTAYDLWNVNQTTPLDDSDGGYTDTGGVSFPNSVSMTGLTSTTAHAAIIDCMQTGSGSATMTAETGRVSRTNIATSVGNFNDTHASSTIMDLTSAGTPTLQWTGSSSAWGTAGVAIRSNGDLSGPTVGGGTLGTIGVGK